VVQRAHQSNQTEQFPAEPVLDGRHTHVCELKKALELLRLVKMTISELPDQGRVILETLAAKLQILGSSEDPVDDIEVVRSVSLEGVLHCL
jgi:hypothetical protein